MISLMAVTLAEHKAVPESNMNAASVKQSVHLLMRRTPVGLAFVLLFAAACQRRHIDASTPRKAAEAFVQALTRNDLPTAKSLAIGSDAQIAQMQMAVQMGQAMDHLATAEAKRFKHDKVDTGAPDGIIYMCPRKYATTTNHGAFKDGKFYWDSDPHTIVTLTDNKFVFREIGAKETTFILIRGTKEEVNPE